MNYLLGIRSTLSTRLFSSLVKQNFPEVCEKGINRQINMELSASYLYLAMVTIDFGPLLNNGFFKFSHITSTGTMWH